MLVFSTRLPLKNEITQADCIRLFIEWVTKSPNYSIQNILYDVSSNEDFDCIDENITFSIRHFKNNHVELSACRLENRENIAVWVNDCIFLCENGKKSLLVQLNCNRIDYSTQLPPIHKPYIIRQFVERGYCNDDNDLPVVDTPLESDAIYYEKCVDIINGEYDYTMPVVYISCDYRGHTVISPVYLAKKLSGIAHVFVEKTYETAMKLRDSTKGNNAYNGYIGIYFPGTKLCQKHSLTYYNDYKEMSREIIDSVWKALINRLDSSTYNWNQIIALQARQKMSEWQDISAQDKKQLSDYMNTFDQENESLREQISELNQQVYSLRSQLDMLRVKINGDSEDSCFYKIGSELNLYAGEKNDLLYSVLSQVQNRYSQNSRGYAIIQTLLEANPRSGECEKIINGVREIFGNGGKLTKSGKSQLQDLGFTIEEDGPHYKLIFHDSRYMFTVAKTPGDHREGKNLISQICNAIDVEKKF